MIPLLDRLKAEFPLRKVSVENTMGDDFKPYLAITIDDKRLISKWDREVASDLMAHYGISTYEEYFSVFVEQIKHELCESVITAGSYKEAL